MVYIYCSTPTPQVNRLAGVLGATVLKNFDGMNFWVKRERRERLAFNEGDQLICWGDTVPELDGVKVLNHLAQPLSEKNLNATLYRSDVPVLQYGVTGGPYDTKRYVKAGWIPRAKGHTGGNDLLGIISSERPEYWTPKMDISEEYRIHSFQLRSLKAGIKIPVAGVENHSWVRTELGGWKVSYGEFKSTSAIRKLAHASIKALGLTFATVDIGKIGPERYVVLDVKIDPSLVDEGVFNLYAKQLSTWLKGKEAEKEADDVS